MHLRGFDEPSWKILRRKIRAEAKDRLSGRIIATDISQQAVEAAKKNAMTAGVERFIEFGICNFQRHPFQAEEVPLSWTPNMVSGWGKWKT